MVTTERVTHQQCCDDPLNPRVLGRTKPFAIMKSRTLESRLTGRERRCRSFLRTLLRALAYRSLPLMLVAVDGARRWLTLIPGEGGQG